MIFVYAICRFGVQRTLLTLTNTRMMTNQSQKMISVDGTMNSRLLMSLEIMQQIFLGCQPLVDVLSFCWDEFNHFRER